MNLGTTTNSTAQAMIQLTIDGHSIQVPKGTTVYQAATQLKIDIPIFCYHDRMPPFGACRMCLVEVAQVAKLQTSCTLEVAEGMIIKTQSQLALEGRESILELLLINHPLDCPICDRGGECPLQDQTVKHGPGMSRFFEEKRQFKKAISLGPVLKLDRERCITCARCTRFGDEIAGDHALEFIDRGYRTEVGTPDGGAARSKFIGNTIMICPVGALTSSVYRFRARPWDNVSIPSTCTLCPVGCSLKLDSRDGEIMRTRSAENLKVNDIWLCDKGWFGYEFTEHADRLTTPLIRRDGHLQPASWEEALDLIAKKMLEAKATGKLGAFGGNPLTIEENYFFQQLMREGLKTPHLDHRIGMCILPTSSTDDSIMTQMETSLEACEHLSSIILCGIDLTEEFPVLWLRIKQAVNQGAKIFYAGHFAPENAQYFSQTWLHAPGKELVTLKLLLTQLKESCQLSSGTALFVGKQYLDSPQRLSTISYLKQVQAESFPFALNLLEGRGNSKGASLAGMHPAYGPGYKKLPEAGLNCLELLEQAQQGWDLLYVVGADPASKYPTSFWQGARIALKFLVVQDLFLTKTAAQADVVLPALSFVEKSGTFLNIEGRLQQLNPGKELPPSIYSDGEIFAQLAQRIGINLKLDQGFAQLIADKNHVISTKKLAALIENSVQEELVSQKAIDEESLEAEALSATFTYALFDEGVRMQHNPHLRQLTPKPCVRIHPFEATKRALQNGDSVTLSYHHHSVKTVVKLDRQVAEGTIVIPLGFKELTSYELKNNLTNGLSIVIKK